MLNQSFTADNFRKIFDYENRKGRYLEGKFFPEIEEITNKLKDNASELKALRKTKPSIPKNDYEERASKIFEARDTLKEYKDKLLTEELEKISNEVTNGKYRIKVRQVKTKLGDIAYNVDNDAYGYFANKQLQYNLRKLYKIQQSNRYNIINQLQCILSDKFPKIVFRTDISNFYESIPSSMLIQKINSENSLTSMSKKFIRQILSDYRMLSTNDGIPRGIGISAYLSELYMHDFDNEIKNITEIVFYARYVDDIIIVISPQPNSNPKSIINNIKQKIDDLKLKINTDKTATLDIIEPKSCTLEYLGYTFNIDSGIVNLSISSNRLSKYKKRIELTLTDYQRKSKYNEKKARKLLTNRLQFLSSNTRLLNNKKNALVGIYFSNNLITDLSCLRELDDYLKIEIEKHAKLMERKILDDISFTKGFNEKAFKKFSASQLALIVKVWKHVA